jgi:transcriptional regulator with XRE-family HTH domain
VEEPINVEELRSRVVEHRRALGLSLRAASEDSGVPLNTLSRVERGHLPDLANFGRLVTWLGLEPAQFFYDTDRHRTDSTTDTIRIALRRDPHLTPEAASQIAEIVSNLYSSLATSIGDAEIHLRSHKTFTPSAARQLSVVLGEMQRALQADDALGDEPGWDD